MVSCILCKKPCTTKICYKCIEHWTGQCSICLSVFMNPVVTNCNHKFCMSCLSTWQKKDITCPLCRTIIVKCERHSDIEDREIIEIENLDDVYIKNVNNIMKKIIDGEEEMTKDIYNILLKHIRDKKFNLRYWLEILRNCPFTV